ncbi:MAG: nucleotidyltransferase, partial [Pelolinea sp.]|nr:nucleotidyltransferase [Pelolinea sp.]
MIPIPFRKDLNEVLRIIAAKLDIDETRYKNASDKYQAVTKWLIADSSSLKIYKPDIYPHGSFALGTIVKPLSNDEYDIDLVCELYGCSGNPEEIKYLIGKRLIENSIYQPPTLEEKNRCWRLNYAREFHLDILPARPLSSVKISDTTIEVPDKDLNDWVISDPKGYIAWFMNQMSQQFSRNRLIMAEIKNLSVEDIPAYRVKTTLQQAIQLIKRNRDIVFEDDYEDKPISIIITTLAGLSYLNEADLFEALRALVKTIPEKITYKNDVAWVKNPVNNNENFA